MRHKSTKLNFHIRCYLFLGIMVLFCKVGYPQFDNIQELTTKNGLSQGMIFDILKDKEGFMWFGTKNGLNRYDGYDFKVFTKDPFDTKSISGDVISKLFEDSKGRLWVGTFNSGMNLFDKETQSFQQVIATDDPKKYSLDKLSVDQIIEDDKGQIWFTDRAQLFRLEVLTNKKNQVQFKIELIAISNQNTHIDLRLLWTTKKELLVYKTSEGILIWDEPSQQFKPYLMGSQYNAVNCFTETSGILWASSIENNNLILNRIEDKVVKAQYNINESLSIPKLNAFVRVFKNPNTNDVVVVSDFHSDIYQIDLVEPLPESKLKKVHQGEKGVYYPKLYFENDHTLWLGTSGYGLRKIPLKSYPFKHLTEGISTSAIHQPKTNDVFFASGYELYVSEASSNNIILGKEYFDIEKPNIRLRNIITDNKNQYWLLGEDLGKSITGVTGAIQGILYELNPDLSIKKEHQGNMASSTYGHFVADNNGYLWFFDNQTPGELTYFNSQTEFFGTYPCTNPEFLKKNPNGLTNNAMYLDKSGAIWVATTQGLYQFKIDHTQKNCDCKLYRNNPTDKKSILNNNIGSVLDDPNMPEKYLWVATKGGGLNKLNKQTDTFEHLTTINGLPHNVAYGLLPDEEKNMWISTNRGLSKFNPKSQTFINYTIEDGLQDDEFNTASFYRNNHTGQLFFGGINGITAFYPKDIQPSTHKSKVFFTNLKINNELVQLGENLKQEGSNPLTKAIEFTKKIELAWYQNQISLQFASLDFSNPEKNKYQYQLSSIDKDWVLADKSRTASYANLASGDYTLRVKGSNSNGIWNGEEQRLDITIYPPWWLSRLAYISYLVLLVTGIWYAYTFQINRIKLKNKLVYEQKEAARLADLDKLKTNFFSNITHEFRTPLTLIIEPLNQILENPQKNWQSNVKLAKTNSERLLNLINQLLDLSKLEQEKMSLELKRGTLEQVIHPIAASFDLLAQQKEITFSYTFDQRIKPFDFDKDKIEKVLINVLSNAIKFTPSKGQVSLTVKTSEHNQVKLSISDTGVGISSEQQNNIFDRFYQIDASQTRKQQGTGIGLALVKELVAVMNGEIKLQSKLGSGSTFDIYIPMVFDQNTKWSYPTQNLLPTENIPTPPLAEKIIIPELHPDARNIALIIEDNQELRQFIKVSVEENYHVLEADNGKTGLQLAFQYIPNIIISDVMMPELDGLEVCQQLKSDEKTAHIPIILLTAKTNLDSKLTGLKQGADAYMNKPFNTRELQLRMDNLIAIREKLQQKFSKNLNTLIANDQLEENAIIALTEEYPDVSSYDQKFLENVYHIVQAHLDDDTFTVENLAKKATMSRTQLHRKLRALLNESPSEFVRNIRLKEAMKLLKAKKGNVSEVAFMTGFSNQKYFSVKFKEKFGISPSKV